MLTSRELVKKTLEFDRPPRIPRDLWLLPWAPDHYPREVLELKRQFPSDFVSAPGFLTNPVRTQGDAYAEGTFVDEWNCTFVNLQAGVIGEVKDPLIKTWADLEKVHAPEEALTIDVEQVNAFCKASDHFVFGGCCPRPFERMQFLRSSEALYVDLAEQPAELFELIRLIHQFNLKELEVWAKTDVDALNIMDDWGAQRSLLISPRMWRKLFKPLYKEYIDLAHAHGKKMFMHSDGYTADIYPDLIELGLDAFNSQLFTMDIEELGRLYKGKITFWGEMDRQHLLPFGTPAEVDQAVRRVFNALNADGGVIAQCEFGAGAKPENVLQVYESWNSVLNR